MYLIAQSCLIVERIGDINTSERKMHRDTLCGDKAKLG